MLLNGFNIVDRNNRPGVLDRVGLRTFFVNDGQNQSPYSISSVSIFRLTDNSSPSTILGTDGLISSALASPVIKMNFGTVQDASAYTPSSNASGIYRLATGQYMVVLDGTVSLSGVYEGSVIPNTASGTGDYIDIWTVKWLTNSPWEIFINKFTLFDDTLFVVTEPLLLTTTHRLYPKKVKLGSKVDLKVLTEVQVSNKNITPEIKNIFKDSVITSAQMQIIKVNEDINLPSRVVVSSYEDTSSFVDVASDNTILLNFDTNILYSHPRLLDATLGPITGTYMIQVRYNILNQTIVSEQLVVLID